MIMIGNDYDWQWLAMGTTGYSYGCRHILAIVKKNQ